jgi:poly-beta-1,6-N-acetyl-D-glucosamine synthase
MVWVLVVAAFGLNVTLWAFIGFLRVVSDSFGHHVRPRLMRRRRREELEAERSRRRAAVHVDLDDVAVLIPAHNEALVIEATIAAIAQLVPIRNVHIVSDGSQDETAELARALGARVLEIPVAGGKARALRTGIEHFRIAERYKAILLLDADTRLDEQYFEAALPLLDDPAVSAVAGYATTVWQPKSMSVPAQVLAAHRERVYVVTQLFGKYGQTWRHTNVTPIVPGFASLYRTDLLPHIEIDAPGLVIEDFNMTFELHRRRLGRIAFTPAARAYTQDPHRLQDYYKQMRRWTLGFFQTVRRNGVWKGKFWAALAFTLFELVSSGIVLLASAAALFVLALGDLTNALGVHLAAWSSVHEGLGRHLSYQTLAIGILLPDYAMTTMVAVIQRRPRYLVLGVFFLALRLVDSVAALVSLPRAWRVQSTGRWTSPQRQPIPPSTVSLPRERAA